MHSSLFREVPLALRLVRHAVFIWLLAIVPIPLMAQVGSPAGPVPPELLKARRAALLQGLEGALAVVSSAGPRGDHAQDTDYREDNDFFYLTGLEAQGGVLILNGSEPGAVSLFLPVPSAGAARWTGPQHGLGDDTRRITGIEDIRSSERLAEDVRVWWAQSQPYGGEGNLRPYLASFGNDRFREVFLSLLPAGIRGPGSLAGHLSRLRLVKDADELRRIRRAVEITSEAHREVWRAGGPGLTELQIEAVLEFVFKIQGAERVGFPSIVGSGPNSVVLHHDKNRRTMEDGDLVVVDIGAEFGYYTADITRTFPVGGIFTPRQRALSELVLGARQAGLSVIGPGATLREVNQAVRAHYQNESGDLCGPETCAPFLVHGVAHWLGMDVHDVGDNGTPLEPGMVFTLEPGLYLPDEGLGIRIEDDIVITEAGYTVLSGSLARDPDEIEAIMKQDPRWVRLESIGSGPGIGKGGKG